MRKLLGIILAGLLWAGLFTAPASAGDRDRDCNPYTYGRPRSCHVAPVESFYHPTHHGFMELWQ